METIKISELPLGTLEGSEELPFVDSDGVTKRGNVSSKANDADVVHKTGDEPIGGIKTFSNTMVVSYGKGIQTVEGGASRPSLKTEYDVTNTGGGDSTRITPAGTVVTDNMLYSGSNRNGSHGSFYINGNLTVTGGSPGLDKVLTSDASGNATWTNIFNNYGQIHPTCTDFNSIDKFGPVFVHGTTNGPPHQTGIGQYYVISEGLGAEYTYSQFVLQRAIPRNVTNPTIYIRYRENGTWGSWRISSGSNTISATNYTTSVTMDADSYTEYDITAQAGALLFNNPSGTHTNGQKLLVRIKDNGTARALTYGTQFASGAATLPTTTTISKKLWIGFEWDSTDSKWYCIATGVQP